MTAFFCASAANTARNTVPDFDFLFVPDFGGTGNPQIFDAYLNYPTTQRYSCSRQIQITHRAGAIQADVDTLFNERALPTTWCRSRLGLN